LALLLSLLPQIAWADTGDSGSDSDALQNFVGSPLLPITRWFNATATFSSHFSGNMLETGVEAMMRGVQSGAMMAANFAWYVTQGFAQFATNFDVLHNNLGYQMDQTVHALGGAVINGIPGTGPLLLTLIMVGAIAIGVRGAVKNQNFGLAVRRVIGAGLIVGVFIVMVNQAGSGTFVKNDSGTDGTYTAAPMSPVWVGQKATSIVDGLTGGIAAALTSASGNGKIGDDTSNLSCAQLLTGMGTQLAAQKNTANVDTGAAATMRSVNAMFVNTAVSAYSVAQYGANQYGQYVWCRGADFNSSSLGPTAAQKTTYVGVQAAAGDTSGKTGYLDQVGVGGSGKGKYVNTPAFGNGTSNSDVWQKSVLAWAACHPEIKGGKVTFTVSEGFANATDRVKADPDCSTWWNHGGADGAFTGGIDKISQYSPDDVSKNITDADVASFVNSLHGSDQGTLALGTLSTVLAAVGSAADGTVLGGLAIGTIVAKIMALLFLFGLVFTLLRGLFSQGNVLEKLGASLKALLGAIVFGAALGILFALITLLTTLFTWTGTMLGGAGNPLVLLWAAFCPVIAVIGLHFMFKALGLPSPVTLAGGKAWGSMLTPKGAQAIGGSATSMMRRGARAVSGRRSAGRAAGAARGRSGPATRLDGAGRGSSKAAESATRDTRRRQSKDARVAWREHRENTRVASPVKRLRVRLSGTKAYRGVAAGVQGARNVGSRVRSSGVGRLALRGGAAAARAGVAAKRFAPSRTTRNVARAGLLAAGVASGPVGLTVAGAAVAVRARSQFRKYRTQRRTFIGEHIQNASRVEEHEKNLHAKAQAKSRTAANQSPRFPSSGAGGAF